MTRLTNWAALSCGLALCLALTPSTAAAQRDPLGLGEFGAFVDPARAQAMINECEAQAQALQAAIGRWQAMTAAHETERQAAGVRDKDLNDARAALAEAEVRWAGASGAEAERMADVVNSRRQRVSELEAAAKSDIMVYTSRTDLLDAAQDLQLQLSRMGMSADQMAAARGPEVLKALTDRCRRLRAWAQLGALTRRAAPLPSPSGPSFRPSPAAPARGAWPGEAVAAWTGQWSCQFRTVSGRDVMTGTLQVRTAASQQGGLVIVQFGTMMSTVPARLFSRLDVRPERPGHGEFSDGEAYDSGDVTGTGRLTLQRRYATNPGKSDVMECVRIGSR